MDRLLRILATLSIFVATIWGAENKPPMPIAQLSRVPITFEQNVGQSDSRYAYLLNRDGLAAGFRSDGVDFELSSPEGMRVRFPLSFEGATANPSGLEPTSGRISYLRGSDPSHWQRNVQTFGKVEYKSLLPGIDLVFYGNSEEVEHDFVVARGADPSTIHLSLPATYKIEVSRDGDAYVRFDGAVLKLRKPIAYQETPQGRRNVAAQFEVSANVLGFRIGNYDHDLPLVIDPSLVFSTYVADGSAPVVGVATDRDGNTYLVGYTFSAITPVAGAIQPTCGSCPNYPDVYVTKLNATGTAVIFSTYLGGNGYDTPNGIQVDSSGNIVFAGITESPDFPVKNGLPSGTPSYAQRQSFVTSLTPDGASLNYSTMLGHSQQGRASETYLHAFALGPDGAAYVAGRTYDSTFPVTPGAINNAVPQYPGNPVFLTKFLPDGTLGYSGIVGEPNPQNGGGGFIGVTGMAVDPQGAVYLHGNAGTLWPTTEGAYQTTIPGESPYAAPFVTKISSDGSTLIYSTFLGPASGVSPSAVMVNSAGEVWVTGAGAGNDFPISSDAYSRQLIGSGAPYLSRLSSDGKTLIYSTFLPNQAPSGFGATYPRSLSFDSVGHLWVAGSTSDHSLPLLNPMQSSFGIGWNDKTGFLFEFDDKARTLLLSTYLGAQSSSEIAGIAIDPSDKVHVSGWALQDLYTTPGAYLSSVAAPPQYVQYLYPFAAVIDPHEGAGVICVVSGGMTNPFPTRVGTSTTFKITLKNCGASPLSFTSFQVSDSQLAVPASQNACTSGLAPGATCDLDVVYTPASETTLQGKVTVSASGNVIPRIITITASGATPHASLFQSSVQFSPLLIGSSLQSSVLIQNSGVMPLQIDVPGIQVAGDYTFSTDGCSPTVYPQQFCVIRMQFSPVAPGERNGTLSIPTDDPGHPILAVTLKGTGLSSYPVPVADHLDFGTAPLGGANVLASIWGDGFFPESVVKINGTPQVTSYSSDTRLVFEVEPSLLTSLGELEVTVFNPAPGGGDSVAKKELSVYRSISGRFRHMVYNKTTGLLYATVPAGASSDPNTVIIIDPSTGEVKDRITVGADPNALGLSGDDQYLFVGVDGDHAVQRVSCSSKVVEQSYAMPNDSSFGGPDKAAQILPVPGSPKSFVAVLSAQRSPSSDGLALFNADGMVNHLAHDYPVWLEIYASAFTDDPTKVYSLPFETYGSSFFQIATIDSAGLHYTRPTGSYVGNGPVGYRVASSGKLLYTVDGSVFDSVSKSKIGKFAVPSWPFILPDTRNGQVFAASSFDASPSGAGTLSIGAYSSSDYSLTGKLYFDRTRTGSDPVDLVRWGSDGFAFISGDDYDMNPIAGTSINIVRTSIARATDGNEPLAITSISPDHATVNSPSLTVSVSGTGFRSDTAASWNSTRLTLTFISSSQLSLVVPSSLLSSPGTATITLSNLNSGGSTASVSFTVVSGPRLVVSTATLDFGSILLHSTSSANTVTLTNSGSAQMVFGAINATGDFSQTNTCGSSLDINASCTVSVVFRPTAFGNRPGALTIIDNAANSPQTIAMSGVGADFDLGTTRTGSSSTSVTAGQNATYDLVLSSSTGFSGGVALACTGVPQYATCTISPSSVTVTQNTSANFNVTVATSQTTTLAALQRFGRAPATALLLFGIVAIAPLRKQKKLQRSLCAVLLATAGIGSTVLLSSCGGGSGGSSNPSPSTPITYKVAPGTYTLQITATSGTVQKTMPLTLTVR